MRLPPLRERVEDIPELAEHFARRYAGNGVVPRLEPEFLARLEQHAWPGNVRELANFMRRTVALGSGSVMGAGIFDDSEIPPASARPDRLEPGVSLEEAERRLLGVTLDATGGNRSRAAEMLGVSLRTVRNKIRGYGLPPRRSYVHD